MKQTEYEGLALHWRFAFPCIEIVHQKYPDRLDGRRLHQLVNMYWNGKTPKPRELERLNPQAIEQMTILGDQFERKWHDEMVVDYFWNGGLHNSFIDKGKGTFANTPEVSRNLCKVRDGRINDFIESEFGNRILVDFNGVLVPMIQGVKTNPELGSLEIGDKVRTHSGYVIKAPIFVCKNFP